MIDTLVVWSWEVRSKEAFFYSEEIRSRFKSGNSCYYSVFQFAIQKYKDWDIQNCKFACCFVWVWNLVAHIEGKSRLRVLENRVQRRIFGPKRDEVTGEWRQLQNEELIDLYSSQNIIRVIKSRRWAGHVTRIGERKGVYRVLVGKREGKRPLGRPRRRWEDNIKMELQEVGCGGVD